MTPPEIRLWLALRRLRADGFHFRRQAPFRGYFLDFVCHGRRLVIEVDGQTHAYPLDHDRLRDAVLAREGYRTLRLGNADIRDNLDGVMAGVRAALAEQQFPHPDVAAQRRPSPQGGGRSESGHLA